MVGAGNAGSKPKSGQQKNGAVKLSKVQHNRGHGASILAQQSSTSLASHHDEDEDDDEEFNDDLIKQKKEEMKAMKEFVKKHKKQSEHTVAQE